MNIKINDVGKKYNRQWIFRHLSADISTGDVVAITGHNGSGKSTLIQILSSFITPSEGSISYAPHSGTDIQTNFAFVSPYQNLIEEFTLHEHLAFHSKFKRPLISEDEIMHNSGLLGNGSKLIKEFSSGMKQRLRLSLAFFYESKAIFLDEPTSNLDQKGVDWYQELIAAHSPGNTIIIASNQAFEYELATQHILVEAFKR